MPRLQLTHEMELMGKLRAGHARPLLFVQRKTFRNPAVLYWPQRKGENAMLPILIVDDEPHIARLIEMTLEPLGQPLVLACDGEQAADLLEKQQFDLVLLDVMLPGVDGFALMDYIAPTGTPVIFLTAKNAVADRVRGLKLGAYDYIVKPFDAKEVTARIKAVLRRSSAKEEENKGVYDFDNLHLDMNRYELKVKGKVVEAPPKELELLACLAGHPNRVYTRDQLLDEVWGFEYYGDSRTIDVHVKRLREKLEGASEQWSLKTVWGVGYKFEVRE